MSGLALLYKVVRVPTIILIGGLLFAGGCTTSPNGQAVQNPLQQVHPESDLAASTELLQERGGYRLKITVTNHGPRPFRMHEPYLFKGRETDLEVQIVELSNPEKQFPRGYPASHPGPGYLVIQPGESVSESEVLARMFHNEPLLTLKKPFTLHWRLPVKDENTQRTHHLQGTVQVN